MSDRVITLNERRELVEAVTRKIADEIRPSLDYLREQGIGVTIFAFDFDPGAIGYISTANREDMIRSIEEWLAYQKAGMSTEPRGERGAT